MAVKEIFILKVEDSVIYKTNKSDERISCFLCLGNGRANIMPPPSPMCFVGGVVFEWFSQIQIAYFMFCFS